MSFKKSFIYRVNLHCSPPRDLLRANQHERHAEENGSAAYLARSISDGADVVCCSPHGGSTHWAWLSFRRSPMDSLDILRLHRTVVLAVAWFDALV